MINLGESGWPDIIGIKKNGQFFGIEVKAKDGVLTDIQKQVGDTIQSSNGIWFVARDLTDVIGKGF